MLKLTVCALFVLFITEIICGVVMANLVHLEKDFILGFLSGYGMSEIALGEMGVIYAGKLELQTDEVKIPVKLILLGIRLKLSLSVKNFRVDNNVVSCDIRPGGSFSGNLLNIILRLLNPVLNSVLKEKVPVVISHNTVSVDINGVLERYAPGFMLNLKEIAVFENEINLVF